MEGIRNILFNSYAVMKVVETNFVPRIEAMPVGKIPIKNRITKAKGKHQSKLNTKEQLR